MIRKLLTITLLPLAAALAAEPATINLPQALEQARQHLASREIDSATCVNLATLLKTGAEHYPESSISPDALQAAWKLANFSQHTVLAVQAAELLVKQSPITPYVDEAFDLVWGYLTANGKDPAVGADFARQSAEQLESDPRAARFYVCAFEGYARAGRWNDAGEMGNNFLTLAEQPATDPLVYLSMGSVALTVGNSKMSREATETFLRLFPKLPHVVNAQLQMGRLHEANGNSAAAISSYTSAWKLFEKNNDKPAYDDPNVKRAAAEALWTLQRSTRAAFDQAIAAQSPDYAFLMREAGKLISNYEKCVHTSSEYGAQAFTEMGHVSAALATISAVRGLERARRADDSVNPRSHIADAIEHNQRAIAYLNNAAQMATATHGNNPDEARTLRATATFAAEKCYELTMAQGAWLENIALLTAERIQNNAGLKVDCLGQCLQWKQNVLPLCLEGFERKCDAVRNATVANLFLPTAAEPADRNLRMSVSSMLKLCSENWSRSTSSIIQVSSSVKAGLRASSSSEMFESNQQRFEQATSIAAAFLPELARILTAVRARGDAGVELEPWEELAGRANADYSNMCASVQNYVNPLLEKLSADFASPEGAIRKNFATLAAHAAQEEYKTLTAYHKLAADFRLNSTKSQTLLNRLAAIDPQKYGAAPADASASRQKP